MEKENNKEKLDSIFLLSEKSWLNRILNWDFKNSIRFYKINKKITTPIRIFSAFGSFPAFSLITFMSYIIYLIYDIEYLKDFSLMMLTAGILITSVILTAPKIIIRRKRPYMDESFIKFFNFEIKNRDPEFGRQKQSFPSGHVHTWFFYAFIFGYFFGEVVFLILLLLGPLMMFARMHLGCHFPSDVIVGMFTGIICGILTLLTYQTIFYPIYHEIYLISKVVL